MRKPLFASLIALASLSVGAETFNCVFTEPFISFTYSTANRNLILKDYDFKVKTIRNVNLEVTGPNAFALKKNGVVLAKLSLDYAGSDGMSDFVYPYSVEYEGLVGGCESSVLKRSEGTQR
jgi:hypothetical protein